MTTKTATKSRFETIAALRAYREGLQENVDPDKSRIYFCAGTGCRASGSEAVGEALREQIEAYGLANQVELRGTGCHGFCQRGPIVIVQPGNIFYQYVQPEDAADILGKTVAKGELVDRLLYRDPTTDEIRTRRDEITFYQRQETIVFRHNGKIDPMDIDDSIAVGGYQALAKVLETMTPEQVIQEVIDSGLRGRGGGGFPTGWKWRSCREAEGEPHYVICNADEGDPGAFMDRSVLEGDPHAVLEGMIIGAYAIGSPQGYIYVRAEYPLAVRTLQQAIAQAREAGLLGDNILGSGFSFDIDIARGGGAFVCGESTALMASVEGHAGEPRSKYIHTVESGLWDKPTNLNNVETWANVAAIINRGADWFAHIGTEDSKGTKIFSVVGKVKNTGLVEVPMGMTLRELVFDICGGVADDKALKAVQTGGPSGGCIPAELLDLPIDYEHLTEAGSMMGSGGMIVVDEDTCMVEVARYFVEFLVDESCGKCAPCREGLYQMLEILTNITQGRGKEGDIELLEELSELITDASLCALGGTAANPVLSTIRYFRSEYEVHIYHKKCPARVCRELITYRIDPDTCTGCHLCVRNCPQEAIEGEPKQPHHIISDRCIKCGICREVCKFDAIIVE